VAVEVDLGYRPAFEYRLLEDRGATRIVSDEYGITQEIRVDGGSVPRYIAYPVSGPEDWKALRARLDPDDPGRLPRGWPELVQRYNTGDRVVQLGAPPWGLFGTLREMMGVERFLMAFYDMPDLVHEMMDHLTDLWISMYWKVCRDVRVDCIHLWEDMAGRNGSLISPALVREYLLPRYRRLRRFADEHGIAFLSLDTDGDCRELLPLFLEAGINLVFPFEVAAGSDVAAYRRRYPHLAMMGGIDKREIAKGEAAIERELHRIEPVLRRPGYIAAPDHTIPPEVSLVDFRYFARRLKEMIES
jgi:uroporphyrinogen decarboxylase